MQREVGERRYPAALSDDQQGTENHKADPHKLGMGATGFGRTCLGRRGYRISQKYSRRNFDKDAIDLSRVYNQGSIRMSRGVE